MLTAIDLVKALGARVRALAVSVLVVMLAAMLLTAADVMPALAQSQVVGNDYVLRMDSIAVISVPDRNDFDMNDDVEDPGHHSYGVGEVIEISVIFNHEVEVNTDDGVPALDIFVGDNLRSASYTGPTIYTLCERDGTCTDYPQHDIAEFQYTVTADDRDDDGIRIGEGYEGTDGVWHGLSNHEAITARGKQKADGSAVVIERTYSGIISGEDEMWIHKVDGSVSPYGYDTVITSSPRFGDTYRQGETIEISVTFNVALDVEGEPSLDLRVNNEALDEGEETVDEETVEEFGLDSDSSKYPTIAVDDSARVAEYTGGSGTDVLTFGYTVQEGDRDADGVEVTSESFDSGTFTVAGTESTVAPTFDALDYQANHKIDGALQLPSAQSVLVDSNYSFAITGFEVVSTPSRAAGYNVDEVIEIKATFSDDVAVSTDNGGPQLAFWVGSNLERLRFLRMSSGVSNAAVFGYTVKVEEVDAGDSDTDGIHIGPGYRDGNGAWHGFLANNEAITALDKHDANGNPVAVSRTYSGLGTQSAHKVDTTNLLLPALVSVNITSPPGNDIYDLYAIGHVIEFTATFNEPVTLNEPRWLPEGPEGSAPQLPTVRFNIGNETREAEYAGLDGNEMKFRYTVVKFDNGRLSIPRNALWPGNPATAMSPRAEMRDAHGLRPDLGVGPGNTRGHRVEAVPPTIDRIGIFSSAGSDKAYKAGDHIVVAVVFNERVWGNHFPQIELDIGGVPRQAKFMLTDIDPANSLNGSDIYKTLLFRYTVADDDYDPDGVSIAANKITLNGGSFTDFFYNPSDPEDLTHEALAANSAHRVLNTALVSSVEITSEPDDHWRVLNVGEGTYGAGEDIEVTVTFDRDVVVTDDPAYQKPGLRLNVGNQARVAEYVSSIGATVNFSYRVTAGDLDGDGVEIPQDAIVLGTDVISDGDTVTSHTAEITSSNGAPADLSHAAVPGTEFQKVDAVPGTVRSVTINSSAGDDNTYRAGDTIQIVVATNEVAVVTTTNGTPQIQLDVGGESRFADYIPGGEYDEAALRSLTFEYTVAVGDIDSDGVSIAANSISLNGGVIEDRYGNPYNLAHSAVAASDNHQVSAPGGL